MPEFSMLTRRTMLTAAGASTLLALGGRPAAADASPAALARAAFIWGFPLVQTRLYLRQLRARGYALNQYYGAPRLATAADKGAAGPNVDTIYGVAWLDLTSGPQVLSVPDTQGRYYSIQLMDAYENSFAYIGRRATGTQAGAFAIAGPGWSGTLPPGVRLVQSSTNTVAFLTRTLVEGEADLPAALAIQAGYTLTPLATYPQGAGHVQIIANAISLLPVLHPESLGLIYFDELSAALVTYPPPAADQPFVASLKVLGISPGATPSRDASPAQRKILADAVIPADQEIVSAFRSGTERNNGWRVRYDVEQFAPTPLERAVENVNGPGYNISKEALYFFGTQGPDGKPLTGARSYKLHFPAGALPPVDAFWSLTLYGADFYLQANPLDRYSIGDRTPGLQRGADDSLTIFIQHTPPASGDANWLPAPAGAFQLVLRAYQPRPALREKQYHLPPLQFA